MLTECSSGSPSYNDLAAAIGESTGANLSRQAVCARFDERFHKLVEALLGHVIGGRINDRHTVETQPAARFRGYRRVLVQDSTIVKLPGWLFPKFSGVSNGASSVCNARIQAVFDLVSARLLDFSIDPYSRNDLAAAPDLELREGDLVLRDRGYITCSEIQRHRDAGADFIYRYKTGTVCLDPSTGEPLDLPALLERHGSLDLDVLLNNPERTRVRLIAQPVDEETASLRRMRARKEVHGHNPSKAVLHLMKWTIFLTNIPRRKAGFARILGIYGLRWRIEIIFKSWKSNLSFARIHRVSAVQFLVMLKARLLVIAALTNIYALLERVVHDTRRRWISLLKLSRHLEGHTARWLRILSFPTASEEERLKIVGILVRHCCYDLRRKRYNFPETMNSLA